MNKASFTVFKIIIKVEAKLKKEKKIFLYTSKAY